MGTPLTQIPSIIARIAPDGNPTPRQRRRIMIEMCLRRQRPGTGSSMAFMRRRTAIHQWPDLRDSLNGILWALVGGVATRAYMPERVTHDMDILVQRADGNEVLRRLEAMGYTVELRLAIPGYLLRSPDGVEINVLLGNMPWVQEALTQTQRDPAGYPVLDLPYLVLMKLQSMRSQDWADVSRMVGLASEEERNRIRKVVARYSPEDSEDLEGLIILGKREMESLEGGKHWLESD